MRILEFKFPDDTEKYGILYEGFAFTEKTFRGTEIRLAAKIFTKLEELGKFKADVGGRTVFELDKSGTVTFEEVEFSSLKTALDEVSWNSTGARRAAPILEWLDTITEDSTKPKLVEDKNDAAANR